MASTMKAPWHWWVAVLLSTAFTLFALLGLIMTTIRNPAFLSHFPPDMMRLLEMLPSWALTARTCGILIGPVAAFLLMRRSRHAFTGFLVVLCGLAVGTLGEQLVGLPGTMRSEGMIAVKAANWAMLIGLVAYTHGMRVRGLLR